MKYYSDITHKMYDTVDMLQKAEFAAHEAENLAKIKREREAKQKEELAAKRKARAGEVEEARKAMVAAQKAYRETLEAFIKDYGTYHMTSSSTDDFPVLFDFFSKWF